MILLYLQDVYDADEEEEILAAVVLGRDTAPHVPHRRRVVNLKKNIQINYYFDMETFFYIKRLQIKITMQCESFKEKLVFGVETVNFNLS